MTHILEDLTHKMEGQPPKKDVIWVLGIHILVKLKDDLPKAWQSMGLVTWYICLD